MIHHFKLRLGLAVLIVVVLVTGCSGKGPIDVDTSIPTPTTTGTDEDEVIIQSGPDDPYYFSGPVTLEEEILWNDVVAIVEFVSVAGNVDRLEDDESYWPAYEFTFKVVSYLKGTGPSQVTAVVRSSIPYSTKEKAQAKIPDFLNERVTDWDKRQGLVFLNSRAYKESGRYLLGYSSRFGEDSYTVASPYFRRWLPDAKAPTDGASDTSTTEQRFIIDLPDNVVSASSVTASTTGVETITLSNLLALISSLNQEIKPGNGSREYEICILRKYELQRILDWTKATRGSIPVSRYTYSIVSGLAGGTVIWADDMGIGKYPDKMGSYWLDGANKDLFKIEAYGPQSTIYSGTPWPDVFYSRRVTTVRPLPAGKYQFYSNGLSAERVICGAILDDEKNRNLEEVTVTAPTGTVHEAFFDPASVAFGTGYEGGKGTLSPASFTHGGSTVTITKISLSPFGFVSMVLSPSVSLSGKHVEFIKTDGTLAARLSIDAGDLSGGVGGFGVNAEDNPEAAAAMKAEQAKAQAARAKYLFWIVSGSPWKAGDKLMIRIR